MAWRLPTPWPRALARARPLKVIDQDKTWSKLSGLESSCSWAAEDTLETIGQDDLYQQRAQKWRDSIQKHRDKVASKPAALTEAGRFERDLEVARHDVAERKITEEELLSQTDSEFVASIGGVLQRLELAVLGDRVFAGFTRDDRSYLDGTSYSVAPVPSSDRFPSSRRWAGR